MHDLRIGLLAKQTGTSTPTIRFYEEIGLLPEACRQEGGQRRYSQKDVRRLQLIRRCRDFGFSVEQVRQLMAIYDSPDSACNDAAQIAQQHLEAIQEKIDELTVLRSQISELVLRCETSCAGGSGPRCTVFDDSAQLTKSRSK
ncbi:HTH-type transcriptional regulator HmrR [Thalassocella blandensis]|nr:HTH-type transcriptional regulator HmrR [Thalassocella blandensis]